MNPAYPLRDIHQPHYHDVLCGRGGGTNAHVGNSHWRMLVAANKELYVTLPKKQKMLLSKSIVNAVRSQNPPGRFLQKDTKTNLWYDVGDQRAQEKTSQALREGAPNIRSKIKEGEGEGADSSKSKTEKKKTPPRSTAKPPPPPPVPMPHGMMPPSMAPMPMAGMPGVNGAPGAPPPPPMHMMYPSPPPPPHMAGSPHMPPMPPMVQATSSGNVVLTPQGMPVGAIQPQPPLPIALPPPIPAQGPIPERRKGRKKEDNGSSNQDEQNSPPRAEATASSSEGATPTGAPPPPAQPKPSEPRGSPRQQQKQAAQQKSGLASVPEAYRQNYPAEAIPVGSDRFSLTGGEGYPAMPSGLEDQVGCSFGSMVLNDAEHARLLNGGLNGSGSSGMNFSSAEFLPENPDANVAAAPNGYQQQQLPPYQQKQPPQPQPQLQPHPIFQQQQPEQKQQPQQLPQQQSQQLPQVHFEEDLKMPARRSSSEKDDKFAPLPVDGGLEGGVGLSFGSMMSTGSSLAAAEVPKMELGGLSFGSAMSISVRGDIPGAVDGGLEQIGPSFGSVSMTDRVLPISGLEDIGTSFGSMTISTQDRDNLVVAVDALASNPEASSSAATMAPPTFLSQRKSKGNLLGDIDTDSEDEAESAQASAQKSAEWEKLKATLAAQSSVPMAADVPPALGVTSKKVHPSAGVPTNIQETTLGRDVSILSAGDEQDHPQLHQVVPQAANYPNGTAGGADVAAMPPPSYPGRNDEHVMPPPPPPMRKQQDDDEGIVEPHQYEGIWKAPLSGDDLDDYNALRDVGDSRYQQRRGGSLMD